MIVFFGESFGFKGWVCSYHWFPFHLICFVAKILQLTGKNWRWFIVCDWCSTLIVILSLLLALTDILINDFLWTSLKIHYIIARGISLTTSASPIAHLRHSVGLLPTPQNTMAWNWVDKNMLLTLRAFVAIIYVQWVGATLFQVRFFELSMILETMADRLELQLGNKLWLTPWNMTWKFLSQKGWKT